MITFEKINKSDLFFLNRVRNAYCEEFLHDSRKFSLKETEEWFNESKPDFYLIFLNKERVGYFRLSNYSKLNHNIFIGADIAPEFSGKGLATESYKKFIPLLFEFYNLNKISLEVLSTNIKAINLYKKLNFTIEGIKREEVYKNGKFVDSIIMSIKKDEYESLYK